MNVLVACEFSGIVRDAFRALGHQAWSCDLLPSERPGPHLRMDVREVLDCGWDLLVAFPPCTTLARSGARWHWGSSEQQRAIEFVRQLWSAPIPKVAIENPVGVLSTKFMKPTQIIQPWQFGHGEKKATCFWLRGLPALRPTKVVAGRHARVHRVGPGKNRWKTRSRTLWGLAAAMAVTWGERAH